MTGELPGGGGGVPVERRNLIRWGLGLLGTHQMITAAYGLYRFDSRPELVHGMAFQWAVDLAGSPLLWVLVGMGLLSIGLFALRRSDLAGLAALGCLFFLVESYGAIAGGPRRPFFFFGLALLGWLAGITYARLLAARDKSAAPKIEILAREGAIGALCAAYVGAGGNKLLQHGFNWADPDSLRGIILTHHPVDDRSPLGWFLGLVTEHPYPAMALAVLTLVVQLGAFSCVFWPKIRPLWAVLLTGFHLNVWALTGIYYKEAIFVVLLLLPPWHLWIARYRDASARTKDSPLVVDGRAFRRAAIIFGLLLVGVYSIGRYQPVRNYVYYYPNFHLDHVAEESVKSGLPPAAPIGAAQRDAAEVVQPPAQWQSLNAGFVGVRLDGPGLVIDFNAHSFGEPVAIVVEAWDGRMGSGCLVFHTVSLHACPRPSSPAGIATLRSWVGWVKEQQLEPQLRALFTDAPMGTRDSK